jgi:hypothetical protein
MRYTLTIKVEIEDPGKVAYICNPSTWEAEARTQIQPGPHSKTLSQEKTN